MIVAICNHKGGTGKTTTALNLGCALALKSMRVMLIDLDPQCNLTYSLGIHAGLTTISDVLIYNLDLVEAIQKRENVDVVIADTSLADVELSLQQVKSREFVLRKLLGPSKNNYDFILIDCPPSRSLLTLNALCAADKVLIPLFPEVLSLQGLNFMMKTIDEVRQMLHPALEISGIAITNMDARKKIAQEITGFLSEKTNLRVFKTCIRTSTRLAEAPSHGKSIFSYDPRSTAAADYSNLASELLAQNI